MALQKGVGKFLFVFVLGLWIPGFFLVYHIATGHQQYLSVKFDQMMGVPEMNAEWARNYNKDCK
jgi:hypothetical protein